ncbi:MAG: CAP domain-containing protein [Caldilineaceae bacterium]
MNANAQTVAMAINQMRAQAGLPPLAVNSLLNLAAQNHVNDMITNYNYSHSGSDGSTVRQRVQRTGYAASTWVSENWVSVNDPSMAIQWWMNSYVHRNNILNPNWHELGIGAGYQASNSQHIFVAVFTAGESGDSITVMPPEPEPLPIPAGGMQYQIQPGDTLLSIGLRYGVEWPIIARANSLSEFSVLQIGQVIRIPGVDSVGGYVADVQAAAQSDAGAAEADQGDTFIRRYTVQQGDTLAGIAAIYNLSWQELARKWLGRIFRFERRQRNPDSGRREKDKYRGR